MIRPLDLMEPEEAVGNLWHDWASRRDAGGHAGEGAAFEEVRPSVHMLLRALGGRPATEIVPVPAAASGHRRSLELGVRREMVHVADFSGERLRLPPVIEAFPARALNRAAYLWLAALAARVAIPEPAPDPFLADLAELAALTAACEAVLAACPGLGPAHAAICRHLLAARARLGLPRHEAAVEARVRALLGGEPAGPLPRGRAPAGYRSFAPVTVLLRLGRPGAGRAAAPDGAEARAGVPAAAARKTGKREDRDRANRRDSFIMHRFEAIRSWAESLNINRTTDNDDQENARKAAEDQDHITLSEHFRRAASRLRLSLDLSPQDAEHERLADRFTYPEWNHRARAHMPDHARVLEVEAGEGAGFAPDPRLTPGLAVLGGALLGLPATWAFARHLRRLMAEADETR